VPVGALPGPGEKVEKVEEVENVANWKGTVTMTREWLV
jgi:hypothetical protein